MKASILLSAVPEGGDVVIHVCACVGGGGEGGEGVLVYLHLVENVSTLIGEQV